MSVDERADDPADDRTADPGAQGTPPGLQFPTDYPIKIVGRPSDEFRARVHAIMLRHAPTLDPDRLTERLSENRNFLSISYVIRAESAEQVVALATDLKACEGVLMLI